LDRIDLTFILANDQLTILSVESSIYIYDTITYSECDVPIGHQVMFNVKYISGDAEVFVKKIKIIKKT
jgi:hypothetical protein